eukprot:1668053-Alexandrium_andersonii.AAC.1
MQLERAKATESPAIVSMFDMYKAFDQINRLVAYGALARAGFPRVVLVPYMSYLESLSIFGVYANGCGEPRSRQCAIPQGCPLSM